MKNKQDYVTRLINLGYPAHSAFRIYKEFLREYHSLEELEEYIASLEKDMYVDKV